MSDWAEGTLGAIRMLAQDLDAESGYPRPSGAVIGASRQVQSTWNGQGAVPWGWRVSRLVVVRRSPSSVELLVTSEVESIAMSGGITLPPLTQRNDATELLDVPFVDPIEARPDRQILTLTEAYQITWGAMQGAANALFRNR